MTNIQALIIGWLGIPNAKQKRCVDPKSYTIITELEMQDRLLILFIHKATNMSKGVHGQTHMMYH